MSEGEMNDLVDLEGRTVTKAEHLYGNSDADEKIRLTFDDDSVLEVGTSEWLHVTVETTATTTK